MQREYRKSLFLLYPDSFEENKEAFLFYDMKNVDVYVVSYDNSIMGDGVTLFFYQGSGLIMPAHFPNNLLQKYRGIEKYSALEQFINNKFLFEDELLLYDYEFQFFVESYPHYFSDNYTSRLQNFSKGITRELNKHGKQFVEHIDRTADFYSKGAIKYIYSDIDFTGILNLIGDKDFEYAINESVAAFNSSLYLAASATAGTAMEMLIVRILELEGEPVDDYDNTEIGFLTNKLKTLGVINKREKKRIMNAAEFRNLASHANKGRAIREDSKVIYQTIHNIASSYFKT